MFRSIRRVNVGIPGLEFLVFRSDALEKKGMSILGSNLWIGRGKKQFAVHRGGDPKVRLGTLGMGGGQ